MNDWYTIECSRCAYGDLGGTDNWREARDWVVRHTERFPCHSVHIYEHGTVAA